MTRVRWDEMNLRILRVVVKMGGRAGDVAKHVGCSKAAARKAARKLGVRFWEGQRG